MEFSWRILLEFSVLSYSTVQPFISIFGLSLCSVVSSPFIGPVPLTLGLDAGQIDWKNAHCLIPDTSLSITLTPQREEKFSLHRLPWPFILLLCYFSTFTNPPFNTHPNSKGVSYKAVTLMGISVLLSLPLTLPMDWNCCHSKSITNGS